MFEFFKKTYNLVAPVDGKVLNLSEVPDQVFAQRLAGDGVAIDATSDIIVAPADGKLSLIFRTNHAFGMVLNNGIEILVHIGLDTVELEGLGFERIATEGVDIKAGEPVIKINREEILRKGYKIITPVLITNVDNVKDLRFNVGEEVTAGRTEIFRYKMK